jgi:hypothetical protein
MGMLIIKVPQSIDDEYVVNDLKSVKNMIESLIVKDYKNDASEIVGLWKKKIEKTKNRKIFSGNGERDK